MTRLPGSLALLALLAVGVPALGQAPQPVSAELLASVTSVAPGESFDLGVRLVIEEGWHIYAPDPGESGLPTTVAWRLPPGWSAGSLRWPEPRTYRDQGLTTRGYEGELLLAATIAPARDLAAGQTVDLAVEAAWLACRLECVPGAASLHLSLPVSGGSGPPDPRWPTIAPPATAAGVSLALAALLAFLGGLLLNLMPCVLPVLSLKVLGLVRQSHLSRRQRLAHGLAYAGGVLASLWLAAGLLLGLREAGRLLGWGFQLQHPAVVIGVALLFYLLGLNLFGVYELGARAGGIGAGARSLEGWPGSLAGGLLAVVVATPCTAPFMGSALGFAVSQPAPVALAVFTALGLGLSLPYLLLAAAPPLARLLPKPGRWMETLKQAMGFLLMGSVVWLVSVLAAQAGTRAAVGLLAALLPAGAGAWAWGRWGGVERSAGARAAAALAAVLLVAGGAAWALREAQVGGPAAADSQPAGGSAAAQPPGGIVWEPWTPERLAALRAEGRTVFVDFTAAWCLTCRVNERTTLANAEVASRLAALGVATLKADWTDRDDAITEAIRDYGRAGVPLYVLQAADGEPIILPELLTPRVVLEALERLR